MIKPSTPDEESLIVESIAPQTIEQVLDRAMEAVLSAGPDGVDNFLNSCATEVASAPNYGEALTALENTELPETIIGQLFEPKPILTMLTAKEGTPAHEIWTIVSASFGRGRSNFDKLIETNPKVALSYLSGVVAWDVISSSYTNNIRNHVERALTLKISDEIVKGKLNQANYLYRLATNNSDIFTEGYLAVGNLADVIWITMVTYIKNHDNPNLGECIEPIIQFLNSLETSEVVPENKSKPIFTEADKQKYISNLENTYYLIRKGKKK